VAVFTVLSGVSAVDDASAALSLLISGPVAAVSAFASVSTAPRIPSIGTLWAVFVHLPDVRGDLLVPARMQRCAVQLRDDLTVQPHLVFQRCLAGGLTAGGIA
jgi:hypothetical protein